METTFILQKDSKYPWFRYRNSREMLNTCNLITMNELYPENGITRFLNLIQMQQGMKNSRWSKSDKIFSYFLFPLSL